MKFKDLFSFSKKSVKTPGISTKASKSSTKTPKNSIRTPVAQIKINDTVWKSKEGGIVSVDVNMGINGDASTCNIVIKEPKRGYRKGKLRLNPDLAKIKIGAKLEVSLGYKTKKSIISLKGEKDVSTVFRGFVSDLELEIDYVGGVIATVTGMDGKMWLMSSEMTKSFGEKKGYSDAVQMIYKENSSSFSGVSIDKTGKLSTPIYMYKESYYDFCLRAAEITGNYFFVYLGMLYFVNLNQSKSVKRTIKAGEEIKRILIRSSPFGIPKTVEVRSISDKDSSKIIKSTVSSVPAIGQGKDATGLTTNIKNKITIYDETIKSTAEAKERAESFLEQRSINLIEAELEIYGDSSIALATGLKLSGFGDPIDNSYVVTGIKHICDFKNKSYITNIHLSANKYSPQSGGPGGALSKIF